MKTEREMFEEWIKNEDPFVGNDDNPDCIWAKKYMWNACQASVQREGYKLVPVRCNNKMAHAAKAVDGRLSAFKYSDVWDAMIGAAP